MAAPHTPPTVGEIVEALQKLDQELPLVVSTHYDNDDALSSVVSLQIELINPTGDGDFWDMIDASVGNPDEITAVCLIGG